MYKIGTFCTAEQSNFSVKGSIVKKIFSVLCFYNPGIFTSSFPFIDGKFVFFRIQDRLRHRLKMQSVFTDSHSDTGSSGIFSLMIFCTVEQINAVVFDNGSGIEYIFGFPADFLFLYRAEKAGCCIGNQAGIGFGSLFKRAEHPGIFFCHWLVLLFIGKTDRSVRCFPGL